MDFYAFEKDPKTVAAVERKLLTISEAAVRLGKEAHSLVPEAPWLNIRGLGNWLRHQYDRIDLEIVWNTATLSLSPLKQAILKALPQHQRL